MTLKKTIAVLLLMAVLLPLCFGAPRVQATEVQAAQSDLQGTIEEQIRAYANSIDKPGADDDAARIIAMHGIMMGGRDLEADEDHALTATLWNSKLVLDTMIGSCEAIIRQMQITGASQLYGTGYVKWSGSLKERSVSVNYLKDYLSDDYTPKHGICEPYHHSPYQGPTNGYDATLDWVGGNVLLKIAVTRVAVTKEQATYKVGVCFYDKFDFDPSTSASAPSAIVALLGSAMFREFTWYSNAELELTVPYSCDHAAGVYHWELNPDTGNLDADTTGLFMDNTAETLVDDTGNYYKLARTVRLYHDQPWVMEYTIHGEDNLLFLATDDRDNSFPMLLHGKSGDLYFGMRDRKPNSFTPWDLYGVAVNAEELQHTYTYRLENKLKTDGSNIVCLTVYDQTTQQTLVDAAPLNHYYIGTDTKLTDMKKTDNWVAGEDLYINYIGAPKFTLDADAFSLKIFENGVDDNFVSTQNVDPTCTAPGGTLHTCAACGYSYTEQTSASLGHDWGAYKSNNDATCQKDGTKTATCKTCGEKKTVTDEGSQADHDWTPATCLYSQTCLICGETQGELGDHDFADATCTKPRTCKVCGETEGECLPHSWLEPNCTDPKKCAGCGLTEGSALGHSWSGVTCQHANTCTVCGFVKGEPKEHTWVEATCTEAKHCAFCGTIEGEPLGHDFVGGGCTEAPVCSRCSEKGEPFGHTWTAADCYSARSCLVCGFADGVPIGHSWVGPTCTEAKYCGVCALVEEEPLGHIFADATCEMPSTCTGCGLTDGEPLGHDWIDADCENPKHCARCAATEGEPLGHTWTDASCTAPKTCTVCGKTEGTVLEHGDGDGDLACDHCGQNLSVPTEPTEPPATTTPTQTPTTVPPAAEPDNGEAESGNGLLWIICGIALAAIGAVLIGLILRKKKN